MDPARLIFVWWLAFGGSHMLMSSVPVRTRLVAALGEWPFRGLYSLVSFATFIPLVITYFQHKHTGPLLWAIPLNPFVLGLLYFGNALAFILIAGGYLSPSPAMVGMTAVRHRPIHDLTRHSLFMGIGLWALMHLVSNGFSSDVVFFGGFVVFAIAGSWHQDARLIKTRGDAYRRFVEETPFFPLTGKHTLRGLKGFPLRAVFAGILTTIVIRYFHAAWFS